MKINQRYSSIDLFFRIILEKTKMENVTQFIMLRKLLKLQYHQKMHCYYDTIGIKLYI